MTGVWLPPGKQRFVDPATGQAMVNGLVYHYIPTTDTPKDTWQDQAEGVLNTNPVVLDSEGQCIIWGEGLYRQILVSETGVQIWDQITGFIATGGGSVIDYASPAEVAAGIITDKVISPYALAQSGVLTIPYATGAEVAAGTINNKAVTPKALADSGVLIIPYASAAEVAALASTTKVITPKALGDSGVLGGAGSSPIKAVTQFGFIGNGVTDNSPFFAAMIADASWDMYVPTGIYLISGASTTLRAQMVKRFWGPGRFLFDDGYCLPGRYSNISVKPTYWPTQGNGGWFHGQTESVEGEWHELGANVRTDLTARYFEGAIIPHNLWYDIFSGGSGWLATATGALTIGAGSAQLNSVDGISVGQILGVTPYGMDGAQTDTITVDVVNTLTKTITFHPNLTANYPNVAPTGLVPGRAVFLDGKRTQGVLYYMRVRNYPQGAGDIYAITARLTNNYQPKAGQTFIFNTSTTALFGGDMAWGPGTSGTLGTGIEIDVDDGGNNVAYYAGTFALQRSIDIIDHGVFWCGFGLQSSGGRPVDVAYEVAGQFRWGLDFGRATLEDTIFNSAAISAGQPNFTASALNGIWVGETLTFYNNVGVAVETKTVSAINFGTNVVTMTTNFGAAYGSGQRVTITHGGGALSLALGQTAIVFNMTASASGRGGDPNGIFPTPYSNVTGDMALRAGNDGVNDFMSLSYNRAAPHNGRLRVRPDVVQSNVVIQGAASIEAATDLVCGANGSFGRTIFTPGANCWIQWNGSNLVATKNGGASYTIIV